MTTPPSAFLLKQLNFTTPVQLKDAAGKHVAWLNESKTIEMINRCEVEGVGTRGGTVKFLRVIPERQRPEPLRSPIVGSTVDAGSSWTINAQTRLGAYLQPLESGKVWALHLARV